MTGFWSLFPLGAHHLGILHSTANENLSYLLHKCTCTWGWWTALINWSVVFDTVVIERRKIPSLEKAEMTEIDAHSLKLLVNLEYRNKMLLLPCDPGAILWLLLLYNFIPYPEYHISNPSLSSYYLIWT